jgi:hypothetical protein
VLKELRNIADFAAAATAVKRLPQEPWGSAAVLNSTVAAVLTPAVGCSSASEPLKPPDIDFRLVVDSTPAFIFSARPDGYID